MTGLPVFLALRRPGPRQLGAQRRPRSATVGATVVWVGSGQEVRLWSVPPADQVAGRGGQAPPATDEIVRPVRLIDTRR